MKAAEQFIQKFMRDKEKTLENMDRTDYLRIFAADPTGVWQIAHKAATSMGYRDAIDMVRMQLDHDSIDSFTTLRVEIAKLAAGEIDYRKLCKSK